MNVPSKPRCSMEADKSTFKTSVIHEGDVPNILLIHDASTPMKDVVGNAVKTWLAEMNRKTSGKLQAHDEGTFPASLYRVAPGTQRHAGMNRQLKRNRRHEELKRGGRNTGILLARDSEAGPLRKSLMKHCPQNHPVIRGNPFCKENLSSPEDIRFSIDSNS
ncbi:uncharacterized protein LOC144769601 [Lissotriton helveticus]